MENILKRIEKLSGKHSEKEIFRDMVKMYAISISNALNMDKKLEKEYLSITSRYSKEELINISQLIGLIIIELENNPRDVLGELFMLMNVGNSKDQYFTPFNVAQLLTTLASTDESDDTLIKVHDPACGSGATIIAKALDLKGNNINYHKNMKVYASDIDRTVLMMCYIQLSLLGINAVCEVKDALSNEEGEKWYTPMYYFCKII